MLPPPPLPTKIQMDPTSTGKFGLGFNSVYHLSETPMFISGKVMCLLDPHQRMYKNAKNQPATGTKETLLNLSQGAFGMLEAFDLGLGTVKSGLAIAPPTLPLVRRLGRAPPGIHPTA
jgi:hypothetical protein